MTPNNINPNSANSDTKQEEHITFSVHDLIQTVIANWYWFSQYCLSLRQKL